MTSVIQTAVADATTAANAELAKTLMPAVYDEVSGLIAMPTWVYNLLAKNSGTIEAWVASEGMTLRDAAQHTDGYIIMRVSAGGEIVALAVADGGVGYAIGDTGGIDGDVGDAVYAVTGVTPMAGEPVVGVDQGTKTFSVATDLTAHLPVGGTLVISGSTGNDGNYTIASATFNTPNTDIVVSEAVPDATVDGDAAAAYGPVTAFTLTNFGTGYAISAGVTTTPADGLGSGLTVNITKVI